MIPTDVLDGRSFTWFPQTVIGLGGLLGGLMVGDVVATALFPAEFTLIKVANLVSTIPFLFFLVDSGYRLSQDVFEPERYPRIAGWTLGGLALLTVFFSITALAQPNPLVQIQTVRWGATVGAGGGVLVGMFEARAIERAIAAERTTILNEELRDQNARLEEFARILAHDLRNPLNVADGHLELLQETYDDESLDRIATAHDRMDEIVEDTLLLAKSGTLIEEPEAVSLAELATRCWDHVATDDATLAVDTTATIVADPERLQHLFENLFRNAIEHAGPTVSIRVGALADGTGFYVEDDGPGIPPEEREAVFESGTTTKDAGSGFGLAIVSQVVDAHGWTVAITDGERGGARFEIAGVEVDQAPA